jgi:nicotinate-nucleotide adenylyltransferase
VRSLGADAHCEMLDMPEFGISSSAARDRAKEGRPLRYVVPEPVARFIEERGIYR